MLLSDPALCIFHIRPAVRTWYFSSPDGIKRSSFQLPSQPQNVSALQSLQQSLSDHQYSFLKRVGILGGSFDPIHKGHLNIAQSAYEEFALDEVWFIPAGHSPNKDEKKMTAADIRAEMTALAIYDIPYFKLSRMEIDAEGTSYTYLTLTKLKEACPDIDFFFIMGADSLDYLEKWYHPEIICEKAVILAAVL